MTRAVASSAGRVGDGSNVSAELVESYTYMSGRTLLRDTSVPLKRVDSCSGSYPYSCSPGSVHWVYVGVDGVGTTCGESNPGYHWATKNKRDNWTVTRTRLAPPDGGARTFERTSLWLGVPNSTGTNGASPNPLPDAGEDGGNALETIDYTYAYQSGRQSIETESRPSALSTTGGFAVTSSARDTSNRLVAQYQSGLTLLLDGTPEERVVARFWTYDSADAGRVVAVSGPCIVNSTSETACPPGAPETTYQYFETGQFDTGKLQVVNRLASAIPAVYLSTWFGGYTPLGEPGFVIDENGVQTDFTYSGHNVTQRSTPLGGGTATWNYTWENEKLTAVQLPQGNFEAYCYRAVTTATAGCDGSAPWTGRLRRVSKANAADGTTGWTESILYDYWPDGTLKSEQRFTNNGGTPLARFSRSYAADAHKRQTRTTTSIDAGVREARAYDAADNVIAIGPAFNSAPNFCRASGGSDGASGALSRLCAQLGYDRAERVRQLDLFRDATSTTPIRTCIGYDRRGNVSSVVTGCNEYASCSYEASSTTTCGGGSENDYVTDDFGNLVEVRLSGTSARGSAGTRGTFRFEFDAQGNIIKRQTEQQRATSPETPTHYLYTFDLVGRQTSYSLYPSTTLSTTRYDQGGTFPWDCPQPIATYGRVRSVADPFITRWYQYDELGRTTKEVRVLTGATSCVGAMTLSLAYSANGNVTEMTYGYGRQVQYAYGDGGATDRPVAVSAAFFIDDDGGTARRTVVDSVTWEPYGGLRSYQMRFPVDAGLVATVDYESGTASETPSSWCSTSAIGEDSDQSGRLRSLRVYENSTSLYRRTYQWRADQVQRISSCYLGDSNAITEDYSEATGRGYDGLQRLRGGVDPNFSSNPGPIDEHRYTYDSRSNITNAAVHANLTGYAFTYPYSDSRRDWVTQVAGGPGNYVTLAYDHDGQTNRIMGPVDSTGDAGSDIAFLYSDFGNGPGADGVFRVANVLVPQTSSYLSYSYWYDFARRRQAKLNPINSQLDVYLYDLGHQLLESHGFRTVTTASPYPTDEYLWLGGRPIAVFRATFNVLGDGSKRHRTDDSTFSSCGRPGDPGATEAKCGLYFLVTDHLSKPVLVLNESRLIAGVGEYEPYGAVNRTQKWWATPSPVPADAGVESFSHTMKELGGMAVDMRVHFPMMDADQECGGTPRDVVHLKDNSSNVLQTLGGRHRGDVWSSWHVIPSAGSSNRPLTIEWAPEFGTCIEGSLCGSACVNANSGGSGVAMREVEYQRYQAGATPFFPPLRFPGQVWDAETDLYENWHRYYSPFKHGYLSPEPLLSSPNFMRSEASNGRSTPTYAHAANNPITHTDPTGLFTIDAESLKQCGAGSRWNYVYDVGMELAKMPRCSAWFQKTFGYDIVHAFSMQGGTRLVFSPKGSLGDPAAYEKGTAFIDCDVYRRKPVLEVVRWLIHELGHDAFRNSRNLCSAPVSKNDEEDLIQEGERECSGDRGTYSP